MATSSQLRKWWKAYECKRKKLTKIEFLEDHILVAPETVDVWRALAQVMASHGYAVRNKDTDSYNCRTITGGTKKSLHSYGIALDVNWKTNPYIDHKGRREVRFSDKATQTERAKDVEIGQADTDMTPGMIADILAIRTAEGHAPIEWGGTFHGVKDAMHFEIDVPPTYLKDGIDWTTVTNGLLTDLQTAQPNGTTPAVYSVIARNGLRLRAGPGTNFDVIGNLPLGTRLSALDRDGSWMLVSINDDSIADGHVHSAFLKPETSDSNSLNRVQLETVTPADLSDIDANDIARLFDSSAKRNVGRYWKNVKQELKSEGLYNVEMLAVALGTIKAETAGFAPIDEFVSKYNTRRRPFDLYDFGTEKASKLGNTRRGDGARFKGRGFVQLTGRYNYTHIGLQIGQDLVNDPALANNPKIAAAILARFLKNKEQELINALARDNLAAARKLVNGGNHGLDRFTDAYRATRRAFG